MADLEAVWGDAFRLPDLSQRPTSPSYWIKQARPPPTGSKRHFPLLQGQRGTSPSYWVRQARPLLLGQTGTPPSYWVRQAHPLLLGQTDISLRHVPA
jgi:hypothetical protein